VLATYALNLGLSPRPGPTGVHRMSARRRATRRIVGAIVPERAADPYRNTLGLASASACAPAALPDGRVLLSYDPGGRGDFGLWVASHDGAQLEPVFDLPTTLELDAAPVVPRRARRSPWNDVAGIDLAADRLDPVSGVPTPGGTFTFECLDVFESGGLPGAPAREAGLRLRFFAVLPRPDRASGDSAYLVREVAVDRRGGIRAAGLPAGIPMFEQLVDASGTPLLAAHGPAHVPGLNSGMRGGVTRCVGCHTGHSRLPVRRR
jgi:hypothetical protein